METIFDIRELNERIELNFKRLKDSECYQIGKVFSPAGYEWYGDKEGRALLAFVSHYKLSGRKIPCMDEMMRQMERATEGRLFFGPAACSVIHEEQLSGHSWLLRGLAEYYEQFSDPFALKMLKAVCENIYLPTKGKYNTYPIDRDTATGGVSGNTIEELNGWALSTDVGCAFMGIDGLSHAYAILKDAEIKALLDEMIEVLLNIDKVALRLQTHCTLSAARGMMRLYSLTGDIRYLAGAKEIYRLYTEGGGMTLSYQNVNWWRRNDTWTEPCAVVDSLMLACELYLAEGDERYRQMAARIYHNGLATAQRDNGGAGTDSVVVRADGGSDTLFSQMFEAYLCCTMRLAEGLWYISEHQELLGAQTTGVVARTENGVYMDGDIVYAEIENGEQYLTDAPVTVDGHLLHPILKYYKIPKEDMNKIKQRLIFD